MTKMTATATMDTEIRDFLFDPCVPYWIKATVETALDKDCVDASRWLEVASRLINARTDTILNGDIERTDTMQKPEANHADWRIEKTRLGWKADYLTNEGTWTERVWSRQIESVRHYLRNRVGLSPYHVELVTFRA